MAIFFYAIYIERLNFGGNFNPALYSVDLK